MACLWMTGHIVTQFLSAVPEVLSGIPELSLIHLPSPHSAMNHPEVSPWSGWQMFVCSTGMPCGSRFQAHTLTDIKMLIASIVTWVHWSSHSWFVPMWRDPFPLNMPSVTCKGQAWDTITCQISYGMSSILEEIGSNHHLGLSRKITYKYGNQLRPVYLFY